MAFVIPTAVLNMQTDHDVDARARGTFTDPPNTINTKVNGSLPLTGASATAWVHGTDGNTSGLWWEFLATGNYDASVDTRLVILNWQFNAPNRVEIDTLANQGFIFRLHTNTGNPPTTDYREWEIAGNDAVGGQARENPKMIVIDMADVSHNTLVGTYTDSQVEVFGIGSTQAQLGGTTNQVFFQRLFVLETTKNATNIPRFTGVSDWDDIITAMGTTHSTKITDEWLKREGAVFSLACPIEFGDNSTAITFNDNGASVFWANGNDPSDPRVRITSQAFRTYLNLRNNVADTATFSGFYDCGDSYPAWDFNQADAAVVTFVSPTFKRTGTFDLGSSITGPANFDDCGTVWFQDNGVDLDGSTFKNPHAEYLLRLEA